MKDLTKALPWRAMVVALIALCVSLGGAAGTAHAAPNVVVVETDDQTVESIRAMKNANELIAGQGTTFENSFVNYALCCPSRATFLTGQYMHNHGVLGNAPPNGGFARFQALHGTTTWPSGSRTPATTPR